MAPSAANLFKGWLEAHVLASSPVPVSQDTWKRFIDDIFLLWTGTLEDLAVFFEHISSFHPTIKFTITSSTNQLPFLDILISLKDSFLKTDIHTKPTDSNTYLPNSPCHPRHVVNNIPYSQFLRLQQLCMDTKVFNAHCDKMEGRSLRRGHHLKNVQEARAGASNTPSSETLQYKPKQSTNRTPFIVMHHLSNPPLHSWFIEVQTSILHTSRRMQQALPHPPVLRERNCNSLRSLLMPSILPTPPNADPGCFMCDKRPCIICTSYLVETSTFNNSTTKESFQICHRLTCQSSNIVYLLYCDTCQQPQYVGETMNTLQTRFYQHRSNVNKMTGTLVTKHFNQTDHSIHNMKCVAVEKVHSEKHEDRLWTEAFWIQKLKNLAPCGLNTLD